MLKPEVNQLVSSGENLPSNCPLPLALTMSQTTPENARVYVRGSYKSLGEEYPTATSKHLGQTSGQTGTGKHHSQPRKSPDLKSYGEPDLAPPFGRGIVPTRMILDPWGSYPVTQNFSTG